MRLFRTKGFRIGVQVHADQPARSPHTGEVKLLTMSSCDAGRAILANALPWQVSTMQARLTYISTRSSAGCLRGRRIVFDSGVALQPDDDPCYGRAPSSVASAVGNPLLHGRYDGTPMTPKPPMVYLDLSLLQQPWPKTVR
jgi:hypothetical protein